MNLSKLIELIQISFLPDKQKTQLIDHLEKRGADEGFVDVFNQYLADALEAKRECYSTIMEQLEHLIKVIEDDMNGKQKELNYGVSQKLSEVNVTNFTAKNKIWDEYYEKLDTIQTDYSKKLKDSFSKLYSNFIQESN